jgi:multidrug efflux pump subunit AcrA (membrane-fusion protein)
MEFRFKALRHARDPDDLDTTVSLSSPRSWIVVFVALVLIIGAVVWAVLGRLPQTMAGSGVLSRLDAVIRVETGFQAVVHRSQAGAGQHVAAGSTLATVTDPAGTDHRILAPVAATVMVADYPAGRTVAPTDALFVLEADAGAGPELQAVVVVPTGQLGALQPDMPVRLTVSTAPSRAFGLLHGRVASISGFPVTAAGLSGEVFDPNLVQQLLAQGPVSLVLIDLLPADTPSGFAWTSPQGPPYPLAFQAGVHAQIDLGSIRPIDYVIGSR